MKIRSLSRFVLASTMFASFTASAVPGLWQQGYGQGNAEYSVTGRMPAERRLPSTAQGTRTRMVSISIQSFLPLPMTRWSVRTMTTLLSP